VNDHIMAIAKGRTSRAASTSTLDAGSPAPEFELRGHDGSTFRLSDQRGRRNVVIAFYPFAFTPV
jgi:peroxiredoxin